MQRRLKVSLAILCLVIGVFVPLLGSGEARRVRVAEGEYVMDFKEADGTTTTIFREEWTLWKVDKDTFEVDGKWPPFDISDISEAEKLDLGFRMSLSSRLHPRLLKMSGGILGTTHKGEITWEFAPQEFRWKARAQETGETSQGSFAVGSVYDLFFPPIAWFVNSAVRRGEQNRDRTTPIKMIFVDDSLDDLIPIDGQVHYHGQEIIKVAGEAFLSEQFELQLDPVLRMFVWASQDGILLALQDTKKPGQRMELVRYKKYTDF